MVVYKFRLMLGEVVLRPPPPPDTTAPSPAPRTPNDAGASGAAPTANDTIQQSATPTAAQHYHQSDRRFHERINAIVTGTLSPPIPISEQMSPEYQHFWFQMMK
ncbi:UNVERIFIED_CONTAM: hypothetical protein Sindi_2945600, partial [Sesamum indicum]